MYHAPVLLHESLQALQLRPDGLYVDATFGGGGHSAAILAVLTEEGSLYAFDQDSDAVRNTLEAPFAEAANFHFIASNFRHLRRQLRAAGVRPGEVDGILADLGVSSYQIDTPERGFSYRFEAALDMRMNPKDDPGAAEVLNTYGAADLQRLLSEYGEVRNARTLAAAIIAARQQKPFHSTGDLVSLCEKNLMGERWKYLSQVFQALRMEVNDEMSALKDFLTESLDMLAPGGRLAVITYHSIEDRMVKNFMKTGNVEGTIIQDFYGNITRPFDMVTKKPLEASDEELKRNPRSRSGKLRIVEKSEKREE